MKIFSRAGENRAAAVLVFNQLTAAGGAFIVNVIASRVLEPSSRGELAFALQLSYLFTVIALMGLERPFMASERGAFPTQYRRFVRLVSPGFSVVVIAGLVLLLIPTLAVYWVLILSAALYVAMNMLSRGVRVAYVTSRQWKPFVVSSIGSQLVIVAGASFLAIANVTDPNWWMIIYTASGAVPFVLFLIAMRTPVSAEYPATLPVKTLREQGMRLLPASLGNTAMVRSDRLLLPIIGSPADLGLYVTVATVMEIAVWPVQQWVDVSLRKWSDADHNIRHQTRRIILTGMILAAAISTLLGLVAYLVVVTLLPAAYAPAVTVIIPLGIASVFYAATRIQQGILIAIGASGTVSIVETIGWVTAVASYLILIPFFGILGAALGSIIGYSVCAIAGIIFVTRRLRSV